MTFSKIFVVYSSHLIPNFSEIAQIANSEGFIFLSLDIKTATVLKNINIKSKFLEDFLSTSERIEIFRDASEARENFHMLYQKDLISSPYEIAKKDKMVFNCYWHEYFLQKVLYEKFLNLGVETLRFFFFKGFGPAIHESASDTFGNYWKSKNQIELISHEVKNKNSNALNNFFNFSKEKFKGILNTFLFKSHSDDSKPILFSCSYQEFYYYKNLIFFLKKTTNNLVLIINNINHIEAKKLSKKYLTDIRSVSININKLKKLNVSLVNTNELEDIFDAYKVDKNNFDYFEKIRWPSLLALKNKMASLIKSINPSMIVFTSLENYSNQMLGEIAEANSIFSLSLPHGILASTRTGISFASKYAVGNKLAEQIAISSGIKSEKVTIFKGLDPEHEYEMDHTVSISKGLNILVLTDPVKSSSETRVYSTPPVGIKDQIRGLNNLSILLEKVDGINLIIKTHPGWPEQEMIEYADKRLLDLTIPSDSSLKDLVPKIDLVVPLNYYGAAIVTVLKFQKPIIFHNTAPISEFSKVNRSYSIFNDSGDLSTDKEQLIEKCILFKKDNSYQEILKRKSLNFYEKLIAPNNQEEIGNYLSSQYKLTSNS